MRCESCIFRQQLDDSGFLDDQGAPRAVFRCQLSPEFRAVSAQYCLYLLDTVRFYEDVARLNLGFLQHAMVDKIKESIETLDAGVCLISFTQEELDLLAKALFNDLHCLTPERVRPKTHLLNRLKLASPANPLRLTRAECAVLHDLLRSNDPTIQAPNLLLMQKLRAQIL